MSRGHLILIFVFTLLIYSIQSSNSSLNDLTLQELKELVEVRNLDPCQDCETKQDYLNYLSEHASQSRLKKQIKENKNGDIHNLHVHQNTQLNEELEDLNNLESKLDSEEIIIDDITFSPINGINGINEEIENEESDSSINIKFNKDIVFGDKDSPNPEIRKRPTKSELEEMLLKGIDFDSLEDIMRQQYRKLLDKKMKEDEINLIKGLIHIFAEVLLLISCIVGISIIIIERNIDFKSAFINILLFSLFFSVFTASGLGIIVYFQNITNILLEWQEPQLSLIVEKLLSYLPDANLVEKWHQIISKISSSIVPFTLLVTCRFILGYSYLFISTITLISFTLVSIGLSFIEFNLVAKFSDEVIRDKWIDIFQNHLPYLISIFQVLQYINVVLILLTCFHFLNSPKRIKEYAPVAKSYLFISFILIISSLLLKFHNKIPIFELIDNKFHIEAVDIFHILLSVAMIVTIIMSRIPSILIFQNLNNRREKVKKE